MIGKGPNEPLATAAYAEGETLFRQAKYKEAAEKFKIAYKRGPDLPFEEDAMFKSGEAYFFCDRYAKSDDGYGQLLKKYPHSLYLDRVVARRFAIARYWEQVDMVTHHLPVTPNWTDKTRPFFDTPRPRPAHVRPRAAGRSDRAAGRRQRDGRRQSLLPRRAV